MNDKTKILIVDDHPAIRKTMVDVLTEEGFATDLSPRMVQMHFQNVLSQLIRFCTDRCTNA